MTMMESHGVDALAARTKARELALARNEGGDAVAVDADGVRYILAADGATLFVVRSHLGGVSRCEEPWVWAVLAGPVGHVANGTFQEWYERRDLSEDHDAHYKDILPAAQVVEKLVLESDKETGLAGEWREAALTVCPMCGGDLDEKDFINIIGRGGYVLDNMRRDCIDLYRRRCPKAYLPADGRPQRKTTRKLGCSE